MRRIAGPAAILAAWITLILLTHRGPHSPYTYAGVAGYRGTEVARTVNPDAPSVYSVTRFFYDGTTPSWASAHNIRLPLHSFFTSIAGAFTRPYMAANEVINWLFMVLLTIAALRAGELFALRPAAMLLALATIYALPMFVGSIGQPMQYIVGPAINFLIILAAITMPPDELRKPLVAGLMMAILTLNYDWYVFGAALAVYLIFVIRFMSRRDVLVFLVVSLAPIALWKGFIDIVSSGEASYGLRSTFFGSVVAGWMVFVNHVRELPLLPFHVTHIGAHISVHEVLTQIWWPLLACCLIALWKVERRPLRAPAAGAAAAPLFLVAFFVLEQLLTAAFDPENNPRRAIPVVCAFAIAWCWIIDRTFERKWWRATFIALFALTALVAFADTLIDSAAAATLYMGETIRAEPKWVLGFQANHIAVGNLLPISEASIRSSFPRASIANLTLIAVAAQLYIGFFAAAFFWILAKARLLPRYAPLAFAGVWLLSGVRFLW